MSIAVQNIRNQVNAYIRNYPTSAFEDMRMNSIFLQMLDLLDSLTAGTALLANVLKVTQADFSDATNCPLVSLDGEDLAIFFNDGQKFLDKGTDWVDLVGGGFTITIADFDATANKYTFYVFIQGN